MTRHTLDPKLDVVFKLLFAKPSNKRLLISLLTAILEPASPIVDVEVLDPEVAKESVAAKGTMLDLLVGLSDGRRVNLEIQASPRNWSMSRGIFYCARVFAGQLSRGDHYDELNPVVGIFILNFNALSGARYHSKFNLLEVHDHSKLGEDLTIHVIELPKLPEGAPAPEAPLVVKWGRFLAARSDEELEQIAMNDPIFGEAKEALEELSQDPRARQIAEERWRGEVNYRLTIAKERREGRAEGREEGREEGRTDALRETVERLCHRLDLGITEVERERLKASSPAEVQAILEHVALYHRWPD